MFFEKIDFLFRKVGDYVALGSKKRTEANDSYKHFTDLSNIPIFVGYLSSSSIYTPMLSGVYGDLVKELISKGIISKNKRLFLAYASISDYDKAIESFADSPEVPTAYDKDIVRRALREYIKFLSMVEKEDLEEPLEEPESNEEWTEPVGEEDETVDLYKIVIDTKYIHSFGDYLRSDDARMRLLSGAQRPFSERTIKNYCKSLERLVSGRYFEIHKDVFTKYNSVNYLSKAFIDLINEKDMYKMNQTEHGVYSAALQQYAKYIVNEFSGKKPLIEDSSSLTESNHTDQNKEIDWETPYIDENGCLTKIANPDLINKLRPCLDTEYRELAAAFNIIQSFYGNRFSGMQLHQWSKLMNDINWKNPYVHGGLKEKHGRDQKFPKKKAVLKVEYPDGRTLCCDSSSDTYVQIIKENYPDLINELGIKHAGVNIVSKELDKKYKGYQRLIDGGWYVMLNSNTEYKKKDLEQISKELDLGLKISIIEVDD